MFTLSKTLGLLTEPLAYVALMMIAGLALSRFMPRRSIAVQIAAITLLVAIGFEAVPTVIVRRLESSYVIAPPDISAYVGMVILGGVFLPSDSNSTRNIGLNDAAERAIVPVALLRSYPRLKIVFSGGDDEQRLLASQSEADRARVFFNAMGVSSDTVMYERESRTTAENAAFSARLAGVNKNEPWLLVTSAWHMPRSLAAFHKAGWSNITALPVDFRSNTDVPVLSYSLDRGLSLWRIALHEYAGYAWYRINGVA